MNFKNDQEKREYFRKLGSRGGKATVKKHGRSHMREIGKKGFAATTKKHFQGDVGSHKEWLIKIGNFNYWSSTNIPMKRDFNGTPVWPDEKPTHPANGNWVPF